MVGVQVAKEFDGRVYIGEVIASVPPEEDEEPATLAATRAPVAAGGGGSGGSVGGGGGGAGLDAPGDILLTPGFDGSFVPATRALQPSRRTTTAKL